MTQQITTQQLNLFREFAEHWQETLSSQLVLLSPEGEVLAQTSPAAAFAWQDLTAQLSAHSATFLDHNNVLAAPLRQNGQFLGYLLALDAREADSAMLMWGAKTFMSQVREEQAMRDMTDELINAWDQLGLIYRVTQNVNLSADLMATLKTILEEIRRVVGTADAFVMMQRGQALSSIACHEDSTPAFHSQTLLDNVIAADRVILCNNRAACEKIWPGLPPHLETMLTVYIPITEARAIIGLINKSYEDFSAGDSKLLAALAQQVGTVIKNFLIHQNLIIKERLSRELEIAAEIQESLLPPNLPQMGGMAIAVSSVPASEVGGDFYDFITVDERNLTLVIGDVSGKGIPAAMLTSVSRTMLRVEAMRNESPHDIIKRANDILYQDLSRADSFVTVFVASINTHEGVLHYANAGHVPAILWRAETRATEQLRATALPVGIYGHDDPAERQLALKPGDVLVLYTDGITEAQAPNGELFGINRLTYAIESRAAEAPEHLQQYIQAEVAKFRRETTGGDDATLLIIKMLPKIDLQAAQGISTIVKTVNLSYPADTQYLTKISADITSLCHEIPGMPRGPKAEDFIYLIELAISEISTNIIKHAYAGQEGEIRGQVVLLTNGIQIDFYDQGRSFNPSQVPSPSADPHQLTEGGYGLHIVRQIMDVVTYEHHPDQGNHWHLIKFVPST